MSAQKKFHLGTGRRKTAVARVRVTEGSGKVVVNHRPLEQFFTEDKDRTAVSGPLSLLDMRNRLDAFINVRGGGITGQAGAASQGVARALKAMFGETEPAAPPPGAHGQPAPAAGGIGQKPRDSGHPTRDCRRKERKKRPRRPPRSSSRSAGNKRHGRRRGRSRAIAGRCGLLPSSCDVFDASHPHWFLHRVFTAARSPQNWSVTGRGRPRGDRRRTPRPRPHVQVQHARVRWP